MNASACRTSACGSSRTRKPGSMPAASGCALRSRRQKPWIVETQAPSSSSARSGRPRSISRARILPRSSPAARSVYVITSSESTSSPSSTTALTNRSTRTAVFPVPAPAATNTVPRASIAARCWAFGAGRLTAVPFGTCARGRTSGGRSLHAGRGGHRRRGSARRARPQSSAQSRRRRRTRPTPGSPAS